MRNYQKNCESAVSPVVGVMLMMVVVIIIAAVVSGFAGNLVSGNKNKDPSLTLDLDIANSGHWSNSYFKGEVTSVSSPIDTKNLKIITSWKKTYPNGTTVSGGATTTPGVVNMNLIYDTHSGGYDLWRITVPYGYGVGVWPNATQLAGNVFWTIDGQGSMYNLIMGQAGNYSWWGNYKLQAGTGFLCRPFGGKTSSQAYLGTNPSQFTSGYGIQTRWNYTYNKSTDYQTTSCKLTMEGGTGSCTPSIGNGWLFQYPSTPDEMPTVWVPYVENLPSDGWDPRTFSIDQMQGVLGNHWEVLRPGDTVNVKIIYIPTGHTIWQKDVVVSGNMQ